ncbi:hypothetical protein V1478_013033, partial [Vespula squamosa]
YDGGIGSRGKPGWHWFAEVPAISIFCSGVRPSSIPEQDIQIILPRLSPSLCLVLSQSDHVPASPFWLHPNVLEFTLGAFSQLDTSNLRMYDMYISTYIVVLRQLGNGMQIAVQQLTIVTIGREHTGVKGDDGGTRLLRLLESSNINESLYNGTRLMISVLSAYISQHEILTSDKAVKIVEVNCIMLLLRYHMHERSFLCYRNDSSENLEKKILLFYLRLSRSSSS